jgi:prepilin-type N-terminal cleavage/methylation domain-containing protein
MIKNNERNQGFTLIEIAMVVVIFSVLMNLFGYGLLAYQEKQKYKTTHFRMAAIEKAIDEFLDLNGRLPCVARLDRRPDQAGFGFEAVNVVAGAVTCRYAILGTRVYQQTNPPVGGTAPFWNRVGSVPVRSLNLPDVYLLDAWGARFTYIVSERQASEGAAGVSMYKDNAGAIRVLDRGNFDVMDQVNREYPPNRNFAEYVLISHGEDSKGGGSLNNGNIALVLCPALGTEDQADNCRTTGNNWIIRASDVISDGDYDDIVIFKAGTNRNEILPSGAIIGFDQVYAETGANASNSGTAAVSTAEFACPLGWAVATDTRGRFIMGATTNGVGINRVSRSSTITVTANTRNYQNLGQVGEDINATTPAYLTTLYCEKQ